VPKLEIAYTFTGMPKVGIVTNTKGSKTAHHFHNIQDQQSAWQNLIFLFEI